MKKTMILALTLMLALLCTVGCSLIRRVAATEPDSAQETQETPAPTEAPSCLDAILGDWKIVYVEIGGTIRDPESVGMQSEFSFYPNGAGKLEAGVGEDVHGGIFVYTVSGNTITIVDEENDEQTVIYDPDADTLRMEHDDAAVVFVRKTGDASEAASEPAEEPDWKSVQLEKTVDDTGHEMIVITAAIPAGATYRILFPNQDDYTYINTEEKLIYRKVRVPVEIFFPNTPLETAEWEIAPHMTMTTADGTEYEIACDSFTYTFPTLSLEITSPFETAEDGSIRVKAGEYGYYSLTGTVSDPSAEVTVNGVETAVYLGGKFMYDFKFPDTATEDTVETITITATKKNCMTASLTIVVEP